MLGHERGPWAWDNDFRIRVCALNPRHHNGGRAIVKRTREGVTPLRALHQRLAQIRADIAKLRRDRAAVKRQEFVEMNKSLQELHKNTVDLATQLTRISQIQHEIDTIKRALKRANLLD
jgi:septal ring factor EnvC (AmiA/AmiB activator)